MTKSIKEIAADLAKVTAEDRDAIERAAKPKYPPGATPENVFGAPHVRKGEDPMGSRGFMLLRLFGAMSGKLAPDNAKIEREAIGWFSDASRHHGWNPNSGNSALVPLGMDLMPEDVARSQQGQVLRQMMNAGVAQADPYEMAMLRNRMNARDVRRAAVSPAQSWLDSTLGGDLVPLPAYGEIIELLRNKEALVNAGARVIPLPPQGAIKFPRITSPTTGTMLGENQTASASTVGTGSLTLQAKKVVSLTNVPNELFRYASAAAEAVIRDDIAKTLALTIDQQCLEGPGDGNNIKGLINYTGANEVIQYTASGVDANGNTLMPQDGYLMAGRVEENNALMEGWIMRPLMWARINGFRSDAVAAGDQAGLFVQALTRLVGDGMARSWCGFPTTTSAQLSRTRDKGTSSNLTYVLGGMWSDFLIGMFGGIEFTASNVSDTAMQNDLTIIRGILNADAGPRHAGAFVFCDDLIYI